MLPKSYIVVRGIGRIKHNLVGRGDATFRSESNTSILVDADDFRSTPMNEHLQSRSACLNRAMRRHAAASFDDLIGSQREARGNVYTGRFCGLEIDDQLKVGRVLGRQIARLVALGS